MPKSSQKPQALEVTLGLMDGSTCHGRLTRFTPLLQQLDFSPDEGGEQPSSRLIACEKVAYIGFHSREGHPFEPPHLASMRSMRIHTVTGEAFPVLVPAVLSHPSGFHAFIESGDLAFERMYFYHHGVRAKESPEPIGEIIVREKLANSKAIEQALHTQQDEREKPLGRILVDGKKIAGKQVREALQKQQHKRMKLGEILIEAGLIKQADLDKALTDQAMRRGKKLGEVLVEQKIISEEELISALAVKFNMPMVDLDEYPIDPVAITEIDEALILKHRVLPVASGDTSLTVAISDPMATEAFADIRFSTNKQVREVLVTPSQLSRHLEHLLGSTGENEYDWLEIESIGEEGETEREEDEVQALRNAKAPPIVRLVNKIILTGLNKRASDIHLLPQEKDMKVAYRVDGDLRETTSIGKKAVPRVIARIKIISGMDISERRLPQDGRLVVRHDGRLVEFRISCIPGIHGESIVMRVLDKDMAVDLDTLGLKEEDHKRLSLLIRKPFGFILATGPTGSGKSTTLFAIIREIATLPLHIITIEDPVESEIRGVNQIQVNEQIGLTFARVLRNVLRHDPDVVMVGEIRDQETAEIAIRAALTGHLMLSTLHTNTAADTVTRLTDIGIPTYLVASALLGIFSQNLVKRLCPDCRETVATDQEISGILKGLGLDVPESLFMPGSCSRCDETGFTGRVMVYEFMEVTDEVRQAIHDGMVGQDLQRIAEDAGMVPKHRHALELACQGMISRDELLRLLI
ncbi:MAG: GspE/PulE family protein [Mariprofundaceae bacterium]|nr:GspE/PulE family protein [Mariprofundaceae bacterium]